MILKALEVIAVLLFVIFIWQAMIDKATEHDNGCDCKQCADNAAKKMLKDK